MPFKIVIFCFVNAAGSLVFSKACSCYDAISITQGLDRACAVSKWSHDSS